MLDLLIDARVDNLAGLSCRSWGRQWSQDMLESRTSGTRLLHADIERAELDMSIYQTFESYQMP